MQVFKFGGASLKDAAAIRNMGKIVADFHNGNLIVVVSAMGHTTNKIESIVNKAFFGEDYSTGLQELVQYHAELVLELFDSQHPLLQQLNIQFDNFKRNLQERRPHQDFDSFYDRLVAYGELFSSMIVYNYLKAIGIYADWLDARKVIKTDELHREGNVDWEITETLIRQKWDTLSEPDVVVTQGFIGSSHPGETVTLGREGSDYTAAIFGYSLQATAVTIWKDVPGILNGDPKFIENTHKYSELSYQEAAEMSYYGAKVIHPKTIRPLALRNIPLYVRSFQQPDEDGTVIHIHKASYLPPAIVIKENQSLISFTMKDFSFISEKKLSLIFHMLDLLNIKINMMQVSALSFSICSDYNHEKLEGLLSGLKDEFQIRYNTSLKLVTLLKYDQQTIDQFTKGREILMEQKTRSNFQVVLR